MSKSILDFCVAIYLQATSGQYESSPPSAGRSIGCIRFECNPLLLGLAHEINIHLHAHNEFAEKGCKLS